MTLAFTPPTSGPVLAALVEAFDLRRFDRQAALSTRNARRYLGGERVAPDAETAVHRAVAEAFAEAGYLPEGLTAAQLLAIDPRAAAALTEVPLARALAPLFTGFARHWDTLVGVLRRRTAPVGYQKQALGACLRLVVVDVAVRLTAILHLARDADDDPVPDFWAEERGTSLWLRSLLEQQAPPVTRASLATRIKVHPHTVDGWLDADVRPTDENLFDLAHCLAPEEEARDLLRYLRQVFSARDLLRAIEGVVGTRYARDMGIRVALYANQMLALTRHSTKTQEENDIKMRMALTCGSLGRGRLAMPWVEAMLNHVWRQEPDPVWRTAIKAATRSWLEHLQDITAKLGPRPSDADFIAKIGIVPSAEILDHGAYLLQANKQELARDPRFARVHEEQASQEGYFGALELKMQALDAVGRRDPLQAIDLLRRAILKDPLNAEIHFRLGCSLWEIGDIASGLAELEIATQLAPDWDRCRVEIAIVLFNQGQVEEAQRRLLEGRAVLSKPSAWLLLHLAHSYERTGPQAKAMETYEEMLQLQPENAEALDRLAHLYFVTGKRRKGADLAKRAAMLGVSTVLDAWQAGYYDKGAVARRPAHRGDDAFLQFPDSCWPEGVDPGAGHDGDVTATRREKARSPR